MKDKLIVYSCYTILIGCFVGAATVACNNLYEKFGMAEDNPAEEQIEEFIEDQTGLQVDLTPKSKEQPQ